MAHAGVRALQKAGFARRRVMRQRLGSGHRGRLKENRDHPWNPTRRGSGLSRGEIDRYSCLLAATAHIAPYVNFPSDRACLMYWDTIKVVKEYRNGNALLAVARDQIHRLATDRYGKGVNHRFELRK